MGTCVVIGILVHMAQDLVAIMADRKVFRVLSLAIIIKTIVNFILGIMGNALGMHKDIIAMETF
jgi:hypothetical protein